MHEVLVESKRGAHQTFASVNSTIEVSIWTAARPVHLILPVKEEILVDDLRLVNLVSVLQMFVETPCLKLKLIDTVLNLPTIPLCRSH